MRTSSSNGFFQMAAVFTALTGACMAQAPDGSAAAQAAQPMTPRQHGPMQFLGRAKDNSVSSTNWSGYAVTGTSFTQALGSWIVPEVSCKILSTTYSAFWVGIDGYTSGTVEQTGTESDCDGIRPRYYAWYEFYPAASILISSVPVAPGNIMSASVTYDGTEFTVTITNVTTGQSYSTSSAVPGAQASSAEWIAEAPCCTLLGGILPLSNFGIASFGPFPPGEPGTGVITTNFAADVSTPLGPINVFPSSSIEQINMATRLGAVEATTSAPLAQDGSFYVTWASQ